MSIFEKRRYRTPGIPKHSLPPAVNLPIQLLLKYQGMVNKVRDLMRFPLEMVKSPDLWAPLRILGLRNWVPIKHKPKTDRPVEVHSYGERYTAYIVNSLAPSPLRKPPYVGEPLGPEDWELGLQVPPETSVDEQLRGIWGGTPPSLFGTVPFPNPNPPAPDPVSVVEAIEKSPQGVRPEERSEEAKAIGDLFKPKELVPRSLTDRCIRYYGQRRPHCLYPGYPSFLFYTRRRGLRGSYESRSR